MSDTSWKIARISWFIALVLFTSLMYWVTWPVNSIGELFYREMTLHTISFLVALISICKINTKVANIAFLGSIFFFVFFFLWGLV